MVFLSKLASIGNTTITTTNNKNTSWSSENVTWLQSSGTTTNQAKQTHKSVGSKQGETDRQREREAHTPDRILSRNDDGVDPLEDDCYSGFQANRIGWLPRWCLPIGQVKNEMKDSSRAARSVLDKPSREDMVLLIR